MNRPEAEARVRLRAVRDAADRVAAGRVPGEARPCADEGLGVLAEQDDRDARPDADEARRDTAGDAEERRLVAREQNRVVAGGDRRVRARVRIDVVRDHDHVHGSRDADGAAAARDGDRVDRVGLGRGDDDVVGRAYRRRVVDQRVRVEVEDEDVDARPDTGAAADRERGRGEDLVELVAGCDEHVRARGRAGVVVDDGVLADRRVRVDGDHVDGARRPRRRRCRRSRPRRRPRRSCRCSWR